MSALLSGVFEIPCQILFEEDDGFTVHHAVFSAAERENIDARVSSDLLQFDVKANSRIRDPRAVYMQQHVTFMCELC